VTHGQGSKAKSVACTHVPPGHFKIDHFPNAAGPKGSVDTQPLLLVSAYALIADAIGNAARAEADAGRPALANPDIATAVATRFAAAFWLASALSTAAGGAALVLASDPHP
jgi:hypothetical protein